MAWCLGLIAGEVALYDYGGNEYWGSSENTGLTPAVRWLLLANVAIYILMLLLNQFFGRATGMLSYERMVETLGFVPADALERFRLWQFITYAFVHSKWPTHVLFNMWVLWSFGADIERHIGARRFLQVYLLSAVGAVLFQIPAAYLLTNSVATPVVGASGAVLAILVIFAGFFPERRLYFFVFGPFPARVLVIILVGIDLALLLGDSNSGVASAVHLGGVICGLAYLRLSVRVEAFFEGVQRRFEENERRAERDLKIDMDNILRKIQREGMESLSREERATLDRASRHFRDSAQS